MDRISHDNPLGYEGYASVIKLWTEFAVHTGIVLLPLAVVALLELNVRPKSRDSWTFYVLIWSVLTGVCFSLVDWCMTKHLMPLTIALSLLPAVWATLSKGRERIVIVCFLTAFAVNFTQLVELASDFESFTVTPAW